MQDPQSPPEFFDRHLRRGELDHAQELLAEHPGLWKTYDIVTGDSPLHMLVEHSIPDRCGWALTHGADIEERNKDGMTPLHTAANMDDGEMVDFFIQHGAQVEALDNRGQTPLLYACQMGCEMAVEHLVAAGANLKATNANGLGMLGSFLGGRYYHDWEQATALAQWLEEYFTQPQLIEAAFADMQRVRLTKDNGKSQFPGLVASIEAAKLRHSPHAPAGRNTPARRF